MKRLIGLRRLAPVLCILASPKFLCSSPELSHRFIIGLHLFLCMYFLFEGSCPGQLMRSAAGVSTPARRAEWGTGGRGDGVGGRPLCSAGCCGTGLSCPPAAPSRPDDSPLVCIWWGLHGNWFPKEPVLSIGPQGGHRVCSNPP